MKDCKTQILSTIPDNTCCSHTFINILISASAEINYSFSSILINTDGQTLEKAIKIINNFYPNIEINYWDNFLLLKGNIFEMLTDLNYQQDIDLSFFYNDCDKLTILKTAFLTCGRFYYNQDNNANSKGYNFEFVLKNNHLATTIQQLLAEYDFNLKKIKRQSSYVVYTKNSNIICDLFVLLGAGYTALDIQNNLAMREIRNNANRQNNCFEFNLDKTINASTEQLAAINYIIDTYSIDYLQENLREVALVRIANPDATLNELKTLMNNKISRAGIKYRLDKIIELYKNLKGDN